MKKASEWLEYIGCKTVLIIGTLIMGAFVYWAGIYTHLVNVDLENKKIRLYEDSIWRNSLFFAVVCAVLFLFTKLILSTDQVRQKKRVRYIAVSATIFAGVIGILWASISTYYPYHDQHQVVLDSLAFITGDFSDLKGYMEIYPHQLGLAWIYEMLFRIYPSYEVIYYLHSIWLMILVYFTYTVTEELFHNSHISLFSIFMTVGFVPMYFYVNYAYGDLGSAACGILEIWLTVKFAKTGKIKYFISLLMTALFQCMIRRNCLIFVIAIVIVLFITALKKPDWKMIAMAVVLIGASAGINSAVVKSYELRSGLKMAEGAPYILHIAMGMQDTYEGPGYYNAYNLTTYVNSNKDAEASRLTAKEYISGRLKELAGDLSYTKEFYQKKLLQQWNEPTFGGELATYTYQEEPSDFVLDIYYGKIQDFLRDFRNIYLFILYAGTLGCVITKLLFTKNNSISENLIWVIFIGGCLFSILWENKSRYVMPYVMILIPYGAFGIYQCQFTVTKFIKFIQSGLSK